MAGRSSFMSKPRAYTCYLCGQQYGSQSLLIHIPQCQEKWVKTEEMKPRNQRRPVPPPPEGLQGQGALPTKPADIDAFNASMYQYWDQVSLIRCQQCSRTFRPEAFEKHSRICNQDTPGGPHGPGKTIQPTRSISPTRVPSARSQSPTRAPSRSSTGSLLPSGGSTRGDGMGSTGAGSNTGNRLAPSRASTGSLPPGISSKPRAYTCYLCGQQYGSHSLMIHIPQCQEKWVRTEEGKLKRERRPLPSPPEELATGVLPTHPDEVDAFNSRMYEYWDKISLMGCQLCGRTFKPDAFEKHQKVCTPDTPGGPLGVRKGYEPPGRASPSPRSSGTFGGGQLSRPRAYNCYLCGQQYGSQSLMIHIPQCQEKWMKVEAGKPKSEQRHMPSHPPELNSPLPTSPAEIDEFNNRMTEFWNRLSLVPCQNCGRTFRPEALAHHRKNCTADNPNRPAGGAGRSSLMTPLANPPTVRAGSDVAARRLSNSSPSSPSFPGNTPASSPSTRAAPPGQQSSSPSRSPPPRHTLSPVDISTSGRSKSPSPRQTLTPPDSPSSSHKPLPSCQRFPPPEDPQQLSRTPSANPAGRVGTPPLQKEVLGRGAREQLQGKGGALEAGDLVCYLCGEEVDRGELVAHVQRCHDQWLKREMYKPWNERRYPPPPPAELGGPLPTSPEGIKAFNDTMLAAVTTPCPICSVPLTESQWSDHTSSCRPSSQGVPEQRRPLGRRSSLKRATDEGEGIPAAASRQLSRRVSFVDNSQAAVENASNSEANTHPAAADHSSEDTSTGYDGEVMIPCESCGRRFREEAHARHAAVCAKVFVKSRKVFDSAAVRLKGTDAAAPGHGSKPSPSSSPKHPARLSAPPMNQDKAPNWKSQSEAIRAAMKTQREIATTLKNGGDISKIPYSPTGPDPSFVQCPYCSRHYAPAAADRHIPKCKDIVNKPKFLKGGTGGSGQGAPVTTTKVPGYRQH